MIYPVWASGSLVPVHDRPQPQSTGRTAGARRAHLTCPPAFGSPSGGRPRRAPARGQAAAIKSGMCRIRGAHEQRIARQPVTQHTAAHARRSSATGRRGRCLISRALAHRESARSQVHDAHCCCHRRELALIERLSFELIEIQSRDREQCAARLWSVCD